MNSLLESKLFKVILRCYIRHRFFFCSIT